MSIIFFLHHSAIMAYVHIKEGVCSGSVLWFCATSALMLRKWRVNILIIFADDSEDIVKASKGRDTFQNNLEKLG